MTVEENENNQKLDIIGYRSQHRNGKLRFAISCSSNMNRSMEVHEQLLSRGFNVQSFGSGTAVKLPGPGPDQPNIYEFDTLTYTDIRRDLMRKSVALWVIFSLEISVALGTRRMAC
jgi:hypothetical protein